MLAHKFLGLGGCVRVMDVVQSERRFLDRGKKFVILAQYQDINIASPLIR